MREEELAARGYDYQVPSFPAYVAWGLNYTFIWMVPFWITEFIMYLFKARACEDGVGVGDWVVIFLWLIFEVLQNFLARTSIKIAECVLCTPFWLYLLFSILQIFFTVYMIVLAKIVLFIELVTCVITVIIQVVMFFGTLISFIMATRNPSINTAEYQ